MQILKRNILIDAFYGDADMEFNNLIEYLKHENISSEHEFSKKSLYRIAKSKDINIVASTLEQIKCLDLSAFPESKVQALESSFFKFLPNIVELNIDYQPLSNPDDVYIFSKLKKLSMKGFNLVNLSFLPSFINLEEVILDDNNIIILHGLENLVNLKKLSLKKNKIRKIDEICELKNLQELNVSENDISDLGSLKNLKQLKKLSANKNMLDNIDFFDGLKNLTQLELAENQIHSVEPLQFLINLTKLDLRKNRIKNIKCLKDLRNLFELSLSGNPLYDDDLDIFPRSLRID